MGSCPPEGPYYSLKQIEKAAWYLLGSVNAKELEHITGTITVPRTNRVYHVKHPKAVLPTRVVAPKKTRKRKNAFKEDEGSKEEPSDQEIEEALGTSISRH